jgi:hypothetical protein
MPSRRLLPPIILILLTCALALCVRPGRAGVVLPDIPVWQDNGEQEGGQFGYAVASAGDVNGDGFADVLLGAPVYTNQVYREGIAFSYYGSKNGLSIEPDWVARGGLKGSNFGNALSTAGDVNGDGYDDVIVGAYMYNDGQPAEGAAFLFSGSEAGLVITPTWSYQSNQQDAQLGYAATSAGDVNGDGYADVIIGAKLFTNEYATEGAAFVFYGSQDSLNTEPDWSTYGGQKAATYGYAVGGAGDVNGDGYDDVVVGAPYYNVLEGNEGAVYLYLGSSSGLQDEPAWVVLGDQLGENLGTSVAIVPDMNQDGLDEIAAGAPGYNGSEDLIHEGVVYLFLGRRDSVPLMTASWRGRGGQPYSGYGISISGIGDVNADGYGDLLVGADLYSFLYTPLKQDDPDEGAAFLYFGGPQGVHSYPVWHANGKADSKFGYSVSAAGDVNGDGCHDFLIGAPEYMLNKLKMGAAFEFDGAPSQINVMYLPLVR